MAEMPELKEILECLLFASGSDGLTPGQVSAVLEVSKEEAIDLCYDLQADFERAGRGIQIVEIAGVFHMSTREEYAPYLEKLAKAPEQTGISQAALETLAIVAYRQPVTRHDIEEVRGVKSDRAIQSLTAKRLIREVGRTDGPGRPILYGTTRDFLEYFGLRGLDELPPPPAFIPEEELEEEKYLFHHPQVDKEEASGDSSDE